MNWYQPIPVEAEPRGAQGRTDVDSPPSRLLPLRSLAIMRRFAPGLSLGPLALALEKPDITYQVYQFPAGHVPVIDGDAADCAAVPERSAFAQASRLCAFRLIPPEPAPASKP